MNTIEQIILKSVERLRRKGKLDGVVLSNSIRKDSGIHLADTSEDKLRNYTSKFTNFAYLHGIGHAKDSWHEINGLIRPIVSAGVIELAKMLPYLPIFDKNHLYRAVGIKLGKNTTVAPRVQFDYLHPELIEIGDNCLIGDGAKIWTHNHGIDFFMIGSVKIGDNVMIGSESIIGPSTMGDNVFIGVGSFVYGNIPSGAKVKGREKSSYTK